MPGILFSTKTAWNAPGSGATDWYDRMFIHPNGNVGIDNMNPAAKLHVNGAIRLDGNASLPTDATANSSSNYTSNFNFKLASNNNGFYVTVSNVASDRKTFLQSGHESTQYAYGVGTLSLNPFGGSVGIGTTSPGPNSKLDIKSPLGEEAIRILDDSSQPRLAIGQIANYGGNLIDSKNINLLFQTYYDTGTGGNIIFRTGTTAGTNESVRINSEGNVGIGTTTPGSFKLAVNGKIWGQEVQVAVNNPGPDYVFEKDYALPSLESVQSYIDQNKHLPEVPSAKEMETNGINLSEMNMLLLKKVEELTMYVIELKKESEIQKAKNESQETEIAALKKQN